MTKKIKRNYIFAICILSLLLILSVVYNFMGGFKYDNLVELNNVVGDNIEIKLNGIGAESKAVALSGASLPNDVIKQNIQITLPNIDTTNLVLRAKIVLDDNYLKIYGFNSWQINESDNYYYFDAEIYKNQTVGLSSEIQLKEDLSLDKNKIYFINIVVELFYADGLNL